MCSLIDPLYVILYSHDYFIISECLVLACFRYRAFSCVTMSKMVKFLKMFLKLSIHACQHQALYYGVVIHFSDIDVLIVLLCILYGSCWKRFYENIVLLSNFEDKPKLRNQSA